MNKQLDTVQNTARPVKNAKTPVSFADNKMNRNFAVNKKSDREFPPLIRKLFFLQLVEIEEIEVLMKMHEHPDFVDKNTIFLNQGDAQKKCYIVMEGWAYRFYELTNGSRQIINFYLPGDIISPYPSPTANHSVASLTRMKVCVLKTDYLAELLTIQPKLGLLFGSLLGSDESKVAEHVVRIGRRSAYKRTAHMLLELYHRLKIIGETKDDTFTMPVSQAILADTLGLSFVHMNRTLRKLRIDNLISLTFNEIKLQDINRLKDLAEYEIY